MPGIIRDFNAGLHESGCPSFYRIPSMAKSGASASSGQSEYRMNRRHHQWTANNRRGGKIREKPPGR